MRKMSSNNKMSAQQKILLLEWLEKPENHWIMNTNTRDHSTEKILRKWEEAAGMLNSFHVGTQKVAERWRKSFVELRSHIRKKHRVFVSQKRAGNKFATALSDVEQRYVKLFEAISGEEPSSSDEISVQFRPALEEEISWPYTDEDYLTDQSSPDNKRKIKCPDTHTMKREPSPTPESCNHPEREAEFVAKGWSIKLDRMDSQQRLLAEKFINDIIMEGLLGNLHRNAVDFNIQAMGVLSNTDFNDVG